MRFIRGTSSEGRFPLKYKLVKKDFHFDHKYIWAYYGKTVHFYSTRLLIMVANALGRSIFQRKNPVITVNQDVNLGKYRPEQTCSIHLIKETPFEPCYRTNHG